MKQRIQWLDVAKCFGIFAIYWGHYGIEGGGYANIFVFQYHVQLLFMVSGCAESLNKKDSVATSFHKILRGLLIPWLFFCVLSVLVDVLETDCELYTLWPSVWKIVQGTPRNSFVAFGLWFLTCLAVIKVIFAFLRKIRNDWVILALCVMAHAVALVYVDPSHPMLPYNADAALYYLLYFGLGYSLFPWINRLLQSRKKGVRILLGVSFLICGGFTAYLYFGKNILDEFYFAHFVPESIQKILTALIAIWFQILLSYIFQDVKCFQEIGQNTLYLCGSEHPVRSIQYALFNILGFKAIPDSSLASMLQALFVMWIARKYLIPIEKRIIHEIYSALDNIGEFFVKKNEE